MPLICYGDCTGDAASRDVVDGVQSDNTSLGTITGKAAARYIESKLGGRARIGILNCDVIATCTLRKAGFKKALAAAGVDVTYPVDVEGYQVVEATPVATRLLAQHPEVDLLWASNQGGTEAIEAAASSRAGGDVAVFGTDISSTLATVLLDPDEPLQFTTGQDAIQTGRLAYTMASTALRGDPNEPFQVDLPGVGFSKANPEGVKAYFRR